jgi:hypothetical protein
LRVVPEFFLCPVESVVTIDTADYLHLQLIRPQVQIIGERV